MLPSKTSDLYFMKHAPLTIIHRTEAKLHNTHNPAKKKMFCGLLSG